MTEATLAVTAGSGTLLRTDTKSISSNTVHREYFLLDDPSLASYNVMTGLVSVATSSDHVLQIMAGASLNVRIRRIRIEQANNATTAGVLAFTVLRLTTAGTGGTSITPSKFDTADGASGATAMSLPTTKGTESTSIMATVLTLRQTVATAGTQPDDFWEWAQMPNGKPIVIPAGTTNGIALKIGTGVAGATVQVNVELTETSYV